MKKLSAELSLTSEEIKRIARRTRTQLEVPPSVRVLLEYRP